MKYKVLAYIGVYELNPVGLFDTIDEAQEALYDALLNYIADSAPEDEDEDTNTFLHLSRIEEVKE